MYHKKAMVTIRSMPFLCTTLIQELSSPTSTSSVYIFVTSNYHRLQDIIPRPQSDSAAYLIFPSIQPTGTIDASYRLDPTLSHDCNIFTALYDMGSHLRADPFPAVPAFDGTFDDHILRKIGIHLSHSIERQAYTNKADEFVQESSA